MSGAPDVLRQEHLNHVLFEGISDGALVNMTKHRDEAVVEQMLRLREQGEHPSLISTTSKAMQGSTFLRAPPPQRPRSRVSEVESPYSQAVPVRRSQFTDDNDDRVTPTRPPQRSPVFTPPPVPRMQRGPVPLTPSAFDMPPAVSVSPAAPQFGFDTGGFRASSASSSSLRSQRIGNASVLSSPSPAAHARQPSKFAELTRQHMEKLAQPAIAAAAIGAPVVAQLPPRRRSSRLSAVESSVTHQRERRRVDDAAFRRRRRSVSSSASSKSKSRHKSRHRGGRAYRYELTLALKDLKVPFNEAEDSTSDLEFILDRTLSVREKQKRVDNIRKGVGFATFVLEKILAKMLPSLHLDGWSQSLMEELASDTHEDTLEQVYRKTFRHGPSNVWLSLAIIVLGTAVAQGKKNSTAATSTGGRTNGGFNPMDFITGLLGFGGGAKKKAAPSTPAPSVAAAKSGNTVTAGVAAAAAASRRKRMAPAEI